MANHPICHVEIPAADPATASQFYADLFGWKIESVPEMGYTMFSAEGGPGGGFLRVGEHGVKVGEVRVYVYTDDIDASLKRAGELGGKIVERRMEIPNVGWLGVFTDPTGNHIALFQSLPGGNGGT